jgi:hypothetical protein
MNTVKDIIAKTIRDKAVVKKGSIVDWLWKAVL